jgi:hypothetical protein
VSRSGVLFGYEGVGYRSEKVAFLIPKMQNCILNFSASQVVPAVIEKLPRRGVHGPSTS